MDDSPSPLDPVGPAPLQRKRRRHRSPWKPAKSFLITAAICGVFLVYFISRQGYKSGGGEVQDVKAPFQAGLSLDDAHFEPKDGAERRIAGVLKNAAPYGFTNVTLRLKLLDGAGPIGDLDVTFPEIGPNTKVPFRTDPVLSRTTMWTVVALDGTPRPH